MARASGHFLNSIKWGRGGGWWGCTVIFCGRNCARMARAGGPCFRINEQVTNPGITNVALVGKRSMFPLRVIYSPQHDITLWLRKKKV